MQKRILALAIAALLATACAKNDELQVIQQPQAQAQQAPAQVQAAAPGQPVIINNTQPSGGASTGDLLMAGMLGHMIGSSSAGASAPASRTVVNKTVINKTVVQEAPKPAPVAATPAPAYTPPKTTYTAAPPPAYSAPKPSYSAPAPSYRSTPSFSSSSFRSSSFGGRR